MEREFGASLEKDQLKSARPIRTLDIFGPPPSGAGDRESESRGGATSQRAGLEGCRKAGPNGWVLRAATNETLACRRERRRGFGGVVRLPRFVSFMLLTIKDVARQLQIKPATLYAWAAHGKIPCRKIHGLIRFDPA